MSIIWRIILIFMSIYSAMFVVVYQWLLFRQRRKSKPRKDVDDKKEMIQ